MELLVGLLEELLEGGLEGQAAGYQDKGMTRQGKAGVDRDFGVWGPGGLEVWGWGEGNLLATRIEAGPETWLRRLLLVAGSSKLLAVRRKKICGTW